jgi:anti-anti-sigma factor
MSELNISNEITNKAEGRNGGLYDIHKFMISGRINTVTSNDFENAMYQALKKTVFITVNLSKVTLLTSVGIRIIMKTYKQCDALGGRFRVEDPSEPVQNVLGNTALEQMLI